MIDPHFAHAIADRLPVAAISALQPKQPLRDPLLRPLVTNAAEPTRELSGLLDAIQCRLYTTRLASRQERGHIGYGLHWPPLDEDYPVLSPMKDVFGTARWMVARPGRGKSAVKAAAARANGANGGRPQKVVGD